MYKNNSRFISKIKGCSPLQLSCNLTGRLHAIGYYFDSNRNKLNIINIKKMEDTKTITFMEDLFEKHPNCYNGWSEDYAQVIIKEALKKLNYDNDIGSVVFTKYACRAIDENNISTEVCYVETEQPGFFYIMRDMVDHINVVYNRWD